MHMKEVTFSISLCFPCCSRFSEVWNSIKPCKLTSVSITLVLVRPSDDMCYRWCILPWHSSRVFNLSSNILLIDCNIQYYLGSVIIEIKYLLKVTFKSIGRIQKYCNAQCVQKGCDRKFYRKPGLLWTWGVLWTNFAKMFSDALKYF